VVVSRSEVMSHAAKIQGEKAHSELDVLVRFVACIKDKVTPEVMKVIEEFREQWSDEYLNRKAAQRGGER